MKKINGYEMEVDFDPREKDSEQPTTLRLTKGGKAIDLVCNNLWEAYDLEKALLSYCQKITQT